MVDRLKISISMGFGGPGGFRRRFGLLRASYGLVTLPERLAGGFVDQRLFSCIGISLGDLGMGKGGSEKIIPVGVHFFFSESTGPFSHHDTDWHHSRTISLFTQIADQSFGSIGNRNHHSVSIAMYRPFRKFPPKHPGDISSSTRSILF